MRSLCLLLMMLTAFARPCPGESRPMNFVVIMADDLGAKELGCYGSTKHSTPNLDALAAGGVRYRTCYSTPLCSPTRVELMTGKYGFRTGWNDLIGRAYAPRPDSAQYDIGAAHETFADLLKQRGYKTALAGKWQLPGKVPTLVHDCGFDEYCIWAYTENLPPGVEHTGAFQPGAARTTSRYWHPSIMVNGKYTPTKPTDYGPDIQIRFIIDFMTRHKDKPFLVYYPMLQTHGPYDPTPDVKNPGQKTPPGLKSNVEYMDHLIGELVAALGRLGLRENTIVLFTGDNGTAGEGKGQVSELGARVPMIVNCPGTVRAGVVSDELIDLSDVLPTLVELAGASPPKDKIDGHSFAAQLLGKPFKGREWVYSYFKDQHMLRDKRWLLEGDGRFFDCGDRRDGEGYKDVTGSRDEEVVAARARFATILQDLPAAATIEPPATQRSERQRRRRRDR